MALICFFVLLFPTFLFAAVPEFDGCSNDAMIAGRVIAEINQPGSTSVGPKTRVATRGVAVSGGYRFSYWLVPLDSNLKIMRGNIFVRALFTNEGACQISRITYQTSVDDDADNDDLPR